MLKKTMHLLIFVSLAVVIIFLSACRSQTRPVSENVTSGKPLTIVTSFYPMYITTMNVTKDVPGVRVVNMTEPLTGCLHDYQLKPGDINTLIEARVFVINGAGMESFINKITEQLPDLKVIDASKNIPLIKGEGEEKDNPHVWASISNAILQTKNIGLQLAEFDPGHAAQYSANTTTYIDKLEELRMKMHQALDNVKKRDIVTFHEAFPYFAREFNLHIVTVIEREPGSEPSAAELANTIQTIKEFNIKVLFAEPQYSTKAAETIANETGAIVFTLDPAVNGPMAADAYLKIMEANMKVLEEALN